MRETIQGYLEAKANFGTRRLTLGGILAKSRLTTIVPLESKDAVSDGDVFIRNFSGGKFSGYPEGLEEYYSGSGAEGDGADLNVNFYPVADELVNGRPYYVDQDYQGVFAIWWSPGSWEWRLTEVGNKGDGSADWFFRKRLVAFEGVYEGALPEWGSLTVAKWGDLGEVKDLRPCLLSLGGVVGKRKLTSVFIVKPILTNSGGNPLGEHKFYTSTDCFLSTGGIGRRLTTADVVICQEIIKVRLGPVTSCDVFGDYMEF
jgi:hypothetical protein